MSTMSFIRRDTTSINMILKLYGMLPMSSPLHTAFYIVLAAFLLVVLDARPTKDIHNEEVIWDALRQKLLRNINKRPSQFTDYARNIPENHIWKLNGIGQQIKHRSKRLGIAGHENIDMMISTLERQKTPSFHPGLSISGNMGSLQRLMNNMRNAG